ncbi:MAG: polyprenyl diphosphate synthase [Bacteroidota bacterium]
MKHISFILDGNRRYAKKYGITMVESYEIGCSKVNEIVLFINENYKEVENISLWAFSKNNNRRDPQEIELILSVIENKTIEQDLVKSFKCEFIGDFKENQRMNNLIEKYKRINSEIKEFKSTLKLNIFINYCGTDDLIFTVNNILKEKPNLNFENIDKILEFSQTKFIPSIDFVVRTGGNKRLSDYCMNLLRFSEIYFLEKYWGEFCIDDLKNIISDFKKTKQNYGK